MKRNKSTTSIAEIKVGDPVFNFKNGRGIVSGKTKRTVTVTFENGVKVKNTYRYSDDYFWASDF